MIKIYYGNSCKKALIGSVDKPEDIWLTVRNYLIAEGIDMYYIRAWGKDPLIIDYGSHAKFFYVFGVTDNVYE